MQKLAVTTTGTLILLLLAAGCDGPANDPQVHGDTAEAINNGTSDETAFAVAPPLQELERFQLSEQNYAVPASHVRSIRRGGADSFVRIKHPEHPIELVFDGKSNGLTDLSGAPRIFSVNDGDYPRLTYHSLPQLTVVCRGAASPRAGCGMKLPHGRATWSVLFPTSKVEEAGQLAEQAITLLDLYAVEKPATSPEAPPAEPSE